MKMQHWLHARCSKLLEEINDTPYTDDSDEIKMGLIMAAMRESSIEMFHRAAENSRKEIVKINNKALQDSIKKVETLIGEEANGELNTEEAKESEETELTSSILRRVDPY